MSNKVSIDIELVTKAFEQALKSAGKSADAFGAQVEDTEKDVNSSFEQMGDSGQDAGRSIADGANSGTQAWDVFKGALGAQVVVAGFNAVAGAAKGLFDLVAVDGVNSAIQQENAIRRLSFALSQNGTLTDENLSSMIAFADQMQETSTLGNETALELLAYASTMGLTTEQSKAATQAAIDYAAATNTDVNSALRGIVQSFNGTAGPMGETVKGFRALTAEQLKAGAGLDLISKQFGGAGSAALETYDGSLKAANNAWGDFLKEIALVVTQNPLVISTVRTATEAFVEMGKYVAQNAETYKAFVSGALQIAIDAFTSAVSVIKSLNTFIQENLGFIKALGAGIAFTTTALTAYNLAVNASVIATNAAAFATTALNLAMRATPIGLIITGLTALGAGLYVLADNWDFVIEKMANFAGAALSLIAPAINTILDVIRPLVSVFSSDLAASIDSAKEKLALTIEELLTTKIETDEQLLTLQVVQEEKLSEIDVLAKEAAVEREAQAVDTKLTLIRNEADTKAEIQLESNQAEIVRESELAEAKVEIKKAELTELQKLESQQTSSLFQELTRRKTYEESTSAERAAGFRSSLNTISQLQNSSNKEMFMVGKAAALAQATISTYQGAALALASAPPPFGYALAAAVTAAGLMNVSKIVSQQPPSAGKFQHGGIVPGSSFSGDRMTASVNSSEMILNRSQQQRLFNMANGSERPSNGSNESTLKELINAINEQPILVQIDGKTVARAVRRQKENGFAA